MDNPAPQSGSAGASRRFVAVDVIAHGEAALPEWGADRFAEELSDLDDAVDDRDVDRWHSLG